MHLLSAKLNWILRIVDLKKKLTAASAVPAIFGTRRDAEWRASIPSLPPLESMLRL